MTLTLPIPADSTAGANPTLDIPEIKLDSYYLSQQGIIKNLEKEFQILTEITHTLPLPKFSDPNISISGHGHKTIKKGLDKSDCGSIYRVFSTEENNRLVLRNGCHKQGCPECFNDHASREARRAWETIHKKCDAMIMSGSAKYTDFLMSHCTISWDKGLDYSEVKPKIIKVLNQLKRFHNKDLLVLSYVIHPYRLKKFCTVCHKLVSWKDKECECGNNSFENLHWEKGVHIHFISNFYTDDIKKLDKVLARYQCNFTNITVKDNHPFITLSHEVIYRSIMSYECNHAIYMLNAVRQSPTVRHIFLSKSIKKIKEKFLTIKRTDLYLVKDDKGNQFYENTFKLGEIDGRTKVYDLEWLLDSTGSKTPYTRREKTLRTWYFSGSRPKYWKNFKKYRLSKGQYVVPLHLLTHKQFEKIKDGCYQGDPVVDLWSPDFKWDLVQSTL